MTRVYQPPRISVLMPVYNGEQFVCEAIESILSQTFMHFEFLILDDGSTDGTSRLLEKYSRLDSRIIVIRRPKEGHTAALANGTAQARGEYLARMDADDISLPQRFQTQVDYLDQHPRCAAVSCRVLFVDEEGNPLRESRQKLTHAGIEHELLSGRGSALIHPATMFRREMVLKAGGYNPRYRVAQDLDLYLRLAETGHLANLPEVLLRMRRHPGSVSGIGNDDYALACRTEIVAEALSRRGLQCCSVNIAAFPRPRTLGAYYADLSRTALVGGNFRTARRHLWKAVRLSPFSATTIKATAAMAFLNLPLGQRLWHYFKALAGGRTR